MNYLSNFLGGAVHAMPPTYIFKLLFMCLTYQLLLRQSDNVPVWSLNEESIHYTAMLLLSYLTFCWSEMAFYTSLNESLVDFVWRVSAIPLWFMTVCLFSVYMYLTN